MQRIKLDMNYHVSEAYSSTSLQRTFPSNVFCVKDGLHIAIRLQPLDSKLRPESAKFVPAEGGIWTRFKVRIDLHRPGL